MKKILTSGALAATLLPTIAFFNASAQAEEVTATIVAGHPPVFINLSAS